MKIMEGIKRLEQEVMEMNNFNVYAIFNHIKNLPELQDKFSNKEKTIKGMYDYIYKKAKSVKQGNVAMVNDIIVYSWAANYFKHNNEELGIEEKKETPTKPVENITKPKEIEKPKEEEKVAQISMFEEVA